MSNKCNCQIPNTDLTGRCFKCGGTIETPADVQERIKAEAEAKYPGRSTYMLANRNGYIEGATAVHERAQVLADALEAIANSPTPANEREMHSWIETARTLATTAREQWKAGKEVSDDA